jgi:hypothetical protein
MIGGRRKQQNIGYDANNVEDQQDLDALGFDDGDLEMIFNYYYVNNVDELIEIYLDESHQPPFNLNWTTREMAVNSPYWLGIYKDNGVEYNKHDIVVRVLSFLEENAIFGGRKRNKKRFLKTRKDVSKKKRKSRCKTHNRRKK